MPLADVLRMTKRELLELDPAEGSMCQPGGAILADRFDLPDLNRLFSDLDEALIETFVVDADGACIPTGSDRRVADALGPAAERLANLSRTELGRMGVMIGWPAYINASITPLDQIPNDPHFDDDQFNPDDGVGVVVTAADGAGTRLALSPLPLQPQRRGLPWAVDPSAVAEFLAGHLDVQQVGANQVMAMARFGQLHAGPVDGSEDASHNRTDQISGGDSEEHGSGGVRSLLVFRADTIPGPPATV